MALSGDILKGPLMRVLRPSAIPLKPWVPIDCLDL
jgi:hypothetical protein